MKTLLSLSLIAILLCNLVGCASPEERKRRDAQRAREHAQYDAERARRDREDTRREGARSAEAYDDFLVGYARSLGKRTSELTASERADARREYDDEYDRGYRGHYGWSRHFWY